MCGRYALTPGEDFFDRFCLDPDYERGGDFDPNSNIAPGSLTPVITQDNHNNHLSLMHWGLIPAWAKDYKVNHGMINARADSIAIKPSFKKSFQQRRCLVPANGFYEWKKDHQTSTPFYFTLKDQPLFAFTGLWDEWLDSSGHKFQSYAIITTDPNSLVEPIHNRMPAILKPEDEAVWLNDATPQSSLTSLLTPYPPELMTLSSI